MPLTRENIQEMKNEVTLRYKREIEALNVVMGMVDKRINEKSKIALNKILQNPAPPKKIYRPSIIDSKPKQLEIKSDKPSLQKIFDVITPKLRSLNNNANSFSQKDALNFLNKEFPENGFSDPYLRSFFALNRKKYGIAKHPNKKLHYRIVSASQIKKKKVSDKTKVLQKV